MRRFDKKKNIVKANLLTEQRYLKSKGILNENGPIVDIDGVSDYFVNQIKIKGEDYMGLKDEIIKTAHGDEQTIRAIYSAIGEKLKGGEFDRVGQAYTSPMLGVHEDLGENGLTSNRGEMQKTGDYPWTTFLGNKEKGDDEQMRNSQASENFKNQFNKTYMGQTSETTNGLYTFLNIKYNNNHGNYDLIFSKPKSDEDWTDKTLWIYYDQTNGYYIDNNEGIELIDSDSKEKVIEMLSHNK